MTKKNVAASVRQRLLNLSRATREDFQLTLTRYAVERLLYRLSNSEHRDTFVLKGAMLFALWTGSMHRPTRDLDLLGFGDPDAERLRAIFSSLCSLDVTDDGLSFDAGSITVEAIREDQEYAGQRVRLDVTLGQARIDLQVDVGFGDAITPPAETVEYPTLLGTEPPVLRAYPRETVVAEKLDAIVTLGMANSRMKDLFDLLVLARTFSFEGETLCAAIAATFGRRSTSFPDRAPVAFTDVFARNEAKRKQWAAFSKRSGLAGDDLDLERVVKELARFLGEPLAAAASGDPFALSWHPGGPWQSSGSDH